ncbi:MAG: STAS domain-containing protein [Planctomycetota bacterium]
MRIERKTVGNVTILAFAGEFDATDLAEADERVGVVVAEGRTRLVANLRELTFIDSMWIGYLLKTARRLKARDGELVLSEPSRFFQRVGQAIGIDRVFEIFPDDRAALEHFGEDGPAA